jgi:endonuclease YncB( thermonuclease family)
MLPWIAVTVLVAGGILAHENWDRLKPVAAMVTASVPDRPSVAATRAPERPVKLVSAAVARPIPPSRPNLAPPAPIPVSKPAEDAVAKAIVQPVSLQQPVSASFGYCGDGPHRNCVADGATFWHNGVKIGLAGIDTAEINRPACENERLLGQSAKVRLLGLLNSGPFTVQADASGADASGRVLRTVERNGRSLGSILVQEGLARPAGTPARAWCS